jgi:hypothetical protein
MTADAAVVAQRLSWVSDALHAAAAISTAHRVGLLAALQSDPTDLDQLARACRTDPRSRWQEAQPCTWPTAQARHGP